jgi:hypothetical protein
MGNAAIIEVAIGLIFVFSLLSILVTQINTVIINFLNLRAKRLKEQLDKVLTDPVIRAKIMTHPLIGMVESTNEDVIMTHPDENLTAEQARTLTEGKRAKVGYIEAQRFVNVLVDVLTTRTGEKLYEELNKLIESMPPSVEKSKFREVLRQIQLSGTGMPQLREMIDRLSDLEMRHNMLVALNLLDAALDKFKLESSDLIPLQLGIRHIRDKHLETALQAVLNTASSLNDAKDKLAQWFDGTMERATERFTREMQRFSLGIGFLLCLILNVDTLYLGRTLWEDPALRTAVAVTAQAAAPQLEQPLSENDPAVAGTTGEDDLGQSFRDAQDTLLQLLNLRLPIGWTFVAPEPDSIALDNGRTEMRNLWMFWPGNNPNWLGLLLQKLIGIIITTIAVAQGAPFWFDLLRKITRGGGSG